MLVLFNVHQKSNNTFDYSLINITNVESISPIPLNKMQGNCPEGSKSVINMGDGVIFCADTVEQIASKLSGGH